MKRICFIKLLFVLFLIFPFESKPGYSQDPEYNTISDHVLKEPYVLYQGDPTGNAIMVQTTYHTHKLKIKWGYSNGDYGSYHDMEKHHFEVDGGCYDYRIWRKSWGHGTFSPNTKVYYKVNVHESHKDYYFDGWFYTSDDNMTEFTFYAYGDTRDGNYWYADVMDAMAVDMDQNYEKRYRLIIHTGDIVFNGGQDRYHPENQYWNMNFFGRGCNNNGGNRGKALWVLARVPVLVSLGNHDFAHDGHPEHNNNRYYFSNWPYYMYNYSCGVINLGDICDSNWEYSKDYEKAYYSCNYGPVHFICISTYPTDGNDQSTSLDVGDPQYNWLEDDLQNNNKSWTVVFCHIPFYDGGGAYNHRGITSCEPLFELYGVDAVLQGHQHCYARINTKKGTENEIPYVTLGGGGVAPCGNASSHADCYAEKLHFARFDIKDEDFMHVYVTEPGQHLGSIEEFVIPNRPKQ